MNNFDSSFAAYCEAEKYFGESAVLSFDVFDTLIHRHVSPTVVLDGLYCWFKKISNDRNLELKSKPNVARHEAYCYVAQKRESVGFDFEVEYSEFCKKWIELCFGEQKSEELVSELKEKELEYELSVLYPNIDALKFIEKAFNSGIKIILVSDMYLSSFEIKEFLKVNGYDLNWFENVYVSSEIGYLKRTGNIFKYINSLDEYKGKKIHHFGDNVESDGIRAIEQNWNGHVVRDKFEFDLIKKSEFNYTLAQKNDLQFGKSIFDYCDQKIRKEINEGSQLLGPVLSSYIHKNIEHCIQHEIKNVYFLSREGAVLKLIFDNIVNNLFPGLRINSHYLYTSRLASFTPNCKKGITWKLLQNCIRNTGSYTIENIFSPFKIDKSKLDKLSKNQGINDISKPLPPSFENWDPFLNLLNDEELNDIICSKGEEQHALFMSYLDSVDFFDNKKVALIDVGWSGQIQDNIYQAIKCADKHPEIHGLYLGCRLSAHERQSEKSKYFWTHADESHLGWYAHTTLQSVFVMETLTRAPHATVTGYQLDDAGAVQPIFKSQDEPSRKIEMIADPIIASYQKNAIFYSEYYAVFCKFYNLSSYHTLPFSKLALEQMIRFPSKMFAEHLGTINNVSDLGSDEVIKISNKADSLYQFFKNKDIKLWPYGEIATLNPMSKMLYVGYKGLKSAPKYILNPRLPVFSRYGYIIPKEKPKCNDVLDGLDKFEFDDEYYKLKELIFTTAKNDLEKETPISFKSVLLSYISFRIVNLGCKITRKPRYYNDAYSIMLQLEQFNDMSKNARIIKKILNKLRR